MSNYMRNRKTLSSVADAYREMYATPNEDILNEELIDSLIEDVRDEEIEDIAEYLDEDENLDESKGLAAKAKKSGNQNCYNSNECKLGFGCLGAFGKKLCVKRIFFKGLLECSGNMFLANNIFELFWAPFKS